MKKIANYEDLTLATAEFDLNLMKNSPLNAANQPAKESHA